MKNNTLSSYHNNKMKNISIQEKENNKILKQIKKIEKELNTSTDDKKKILKKEIEELKSKLIDTNDIRDNYLMSVFTQLNEYFNNEPDKEIEKKTHTSFFDNKKTTNIEEFIENKSSDNKKDIFDKYKEIIEDNYIGNNEYIKDYTICNNCAIPMKLYHNNSCYVCEECGSINDIIIELEKKTFSLNTLEPNVFAYKRIDHFVEWLNNLQGKGKIMVQQEIIDQVIKDLTKNKIIGINITKKHIKHALERIELSKYNDQTSYILLKITNVKAPKFGKELEEKMIQMFKQVQEPFAKHCPKDRSNFLNYSYCIRKFLELSNKEEYLKYIGELKSREKLCKQEMIWEAICGELRWEFIPSI